MNSSGVFSATYDDQDRIETYGSMVYGFTDNGELESKLDTSTGDLTTYEYDALGNLRSVVLPDGTEIEYLVDGQGRRVGKLVDGVLESAWLWRGQLQPVAELDGAGNVVARYVYAGGVNVPEAIVMASGPTYRLVKDHLGSVRMVVDEASGAVVQELAYDAWGRVVVDTNPGLQAFGFAGGLYDAETGLVRFGARDYDAETGRWTRKDPIRFGGGLSLFGYSGTDPINHRDPGGLDWLDDALGAFAPVGLCLLSGCDSPPAPTIATGRRYDLGQDPSGVSCKAGDYCDLPEPAISPPAPPLEPFVPMIRYPECHVVRISDIDSCCRKATGYTGEDFEEEMCPAVPDEDLGKYNKFKFCQSESYMANGF